MSRSRALPPPSPVDIGLVAALPIEVGPLRERLGETRTYADPEGHKRPVIEGALQGRPVALIVAGVGRRSATKGALRLIEGHRPRWILSIGFAGALNPDLTLNDLLLPTEVLRADDPGVHYRVSFEAPASTDAKRFPFRSGRLATVDRIVRTASEKRELRERLNADAVDMESSAVAALCEQRAVRFMAVRAISDDATTDLPPEVLSVLGPTGGFRLGATLGALWNRPSSVSDLWKLRERAGSAADRLAESLPKLLELLD